MGQKAKIYKDEEAMDNYCENIYSEVAYNILLRKVITNVLHIHSKTNLTMSDCFNLVSK